MFISHLPHLQVTVFLGSYVRYYLRIGNQLKLCIWPFLHIKILNKYFDCLFRLSCQIACIHLNNETFTFFQFVKKRLSGEGGTNLVPWQLALISAKLYVFIFTLVSVFVSRLNMHWVLSCHFNVMCIFQKEKCFYYWKKHELIVKSEFRAQLKYV